MYAALGILRKSLSKAFEQMHARRVSALLEAVNALIRGRRLVLMDLARACAAAQGDGRVKAALKRLDRLLGNVRLHAERHCLYAGMAHWLMVNPHPLIVVDWSDLQGHGKKFLLRAAIPVRGQALTVLEEVYEEHQKQKPHIERAFLQRLKKILPQWARPIIVTDAGFKRPWFRAVRRLGWDYLGRVRGGCTQVRLGAADRVSSVSELYEQATAQVRCFEYAGLGKHKRLRCRLVLFRKPRCGRIRTTHRGQRSQSVRSKRAEKGAKEPWLLATSLSSQEFTGEQIAQLYAQRMQIEKSFRDLKCAQYGCAFDHSLTGSCERLGVLLLIHALATFAAWLSGLTLDEREGLNKYGGVHAPRPRRHYSLLRLGWEALRRADPCLLITSLYESLRNWASRTEQIPAYAR